MSDEDLISQWKKGAKQVVPPQSSGDTPDNPAGSAELSDAELDSIAGGSAPEGTESFKSIGCCTSIFCPPDAS